MKMAVLRGEKLSKKFPGVVALDDVDIQIESGKVHALVGANGAGKSTLVKILTGYYESYEGEISIDGKKIVLRDPREAFQNGIEVVHQEVDTQLVPTLTVAENLYLESFNGGEFGTVISSRKLKRKAEADLNRIGFPLPVSMKVEDLSLHEKQQLVIARALIHNVKFLILDEPTSSLSLLEAQKLFDLVSNLKQRGVGILYISQRLDEIPIVADHITVLRNGKKVAYFDQVPELSQIVEAMLDVPQGNLFPEKKESTPSEVVMKVENLAWKDKVRQVSFEVRKGEILAITGLTGAGKTETLKLLFGAYQPEGGKISIDGVPVKIKDPTKAIEKGVYLVPEERRREGLILNKSARENMTMPFMKDFCRFLGRIIKTVEIKHTSEIAKRVHLMPLDVERQAQYFSGGNQQKIVVGRWLGGNPKVLLLDEPTQGVDVGAKREIYKLVTEISKNCAVVFATSDINEAIGIGDRILVMRDGKVMAEFTSQNADAKEILSYAAGVKS
ncbi:MAG TPA: sugar ABC transporter ATP-binding protein [Pseudothermotoga sp.]|mgnify:CR=1 FL=1|nr:sugar ABC transporter ATP-binding protein [Pseudothermotoga sp.]